MTHSSDAGSESQTIGTGWRDWNERFLPFKQRHSRWWNERIGANDEPAYILSASIVDALSKESPAQANSRTIHRLLTKPDQEAENEFRKLCAWFQTGTIGVWMGQPVVYASLFPVAENLGFNHPAVETDNNLLKEADPSWSTTTEDLMTAAKNSQRPVAEHHHVMMGYVGYLSSHEPFVKARNSLKEAWESFPEEIRRMILPVIIMPSPFPPEQWPEATQLPEECAVFCHNLRAVLQKYELTTFVTWDLPKPQGTLQGCTAGMISNLRGPEAVVEYTPSWQPVSGHVDAREERQARQKRQGKAAGIADKLPLKEVAARRRPDGTFEMRERETQFRIWLAEETVRRRYGEIRGVKTRLDAALAEDLEISVERVKRLRGKYARLLDDCNH